MITHINKKNKPIIVDISSKKETKRFAKAIGTVQFSKTTFNQIKSLTTKKGNRGINLKNKTLLRGLSQRLILISLTFFENFFSTQSLNK